MSASDARASAAPAPTGTAAIPSPTPIAVGVTRDDAITLIRSISEVIRIDRIEAKLVTWPEFEPVGMGVDRTGGPLHGGGTPEIVWAVAIAGDAAPELSSYAPVRHYPWALYGVNAKRLQISTLKVGDAGTWPPGFDALPDHIAIGVPAPTPSPVPMVFDHLVTSPGHFVKLPIQEMVAADADATQLWAITLAGVDAAGRAVTDLVRSDDGGQSWTTVASPARRPASVTALGSVVLVSDAGLDTAERGTSTSGGLFASLDGGRRWSRVTSEAVMRVAAFVYRGGPLFLAEHWWATKGAATGASRIFASQDGIAWRQIGEVPGPASFGMADVPLVTFAKNIAGDGFYRVEGGDPTSMTLVPIPGTTQACCGEITAGPGGDLWTFVGASRDLMRSTDGAHTWTRASTGIGARVAGIFTSRGALYAIGDGAYRWDGVAWQEVPMVVGKAIAVFSVGNSVIVQGAGDGTLYRALRAGGG